MAANAGFNAGQFLAGGGSGGFNSALGGIGGLLGSGLGSLFGGNPSGAAMPYLNQISDVLKQYLGPYASAGTSMLPGLQNNYGAITSNPGGMVNSFGANYHQSPGFQFQTDQALGAANRAASAGGMAGTPQEQQKIAGTVNDLADQDYYQYLNNTEDLYKTGLSGEQNIYNTGAAASTSLGENLAQGLLSQANTAYAGQANQNQGFGALLGGLGSLAGFL